MKQSQQNQVLERIEDALKRGAALLSTIGPELRSAVKKSSGEPVTGTDRLMDEKLREWLFRPELGEGWLSEESADDQSRLHCRNVWVVDPLDGTLEFVAGIPEWVISVGFVSDGVAVAGGICNPQTGEVILGSESTGVLYNGAPARVAERPVGRKPVVLASRSEVKRGEWGGDGTADFETKAVGSVAYKLGLVAAGKADATWTLVPKHEWDVAAGVALVRAAGGAVYLPNREEPRFNNQSPLFEGLVAHSPGVMPEVTKALSIQRRL